MRTSFLISEFTQRISKEQAAELVEKNLSFIKRTIKDKINLYSPLKPELALNEFLMQIKDQGFKIVRDFTPHCGTEICVLIFFKNLINDFLAEQAYYANDKDNFIEKFVKKICKKSEKIRIPLSLCPDITDFVKEKLESNNLKIPKRFAGRNKSKFTSFLYKVTVRLVFTYLRKYPLGVCGESQDPDDTERFMNLDLFKGKGLQNGPHLNCEAQEIKKRIEALDSIEKVAFKMYLEYKNISMIARTLKISGHKVRKILKNAIQKILKEVNSLNFKKFLKKGK